MWASNLDNSTTTFEGGFLDNTQKEEGAAKARRVQTLVPVMIKHLLSFKSVEDIMVWDISARMFQIVGIVRNVEETATKLSYDIEDETGTIVALKWLEADKKTADRTELINTYVRVIGLLREQNDKRHILILRMWPLEKLNALTNHLLEVTYVMLKAEAMTSNGTAAKPADTTANEETSENNPYYGMTTEQSLVYKIVHAENESESGIERSQVKLKVPKNVIPQVDTILDFLVSEGHIYTTSTDDHFKTT